MKHGKFYIVKAICLLLMFTLLVSGCEFDTPTAETPTDEVTTTPPTDKPETPPWLGVLCPEVDTLPPDDPAYTPVFGEITQEGDFFIRIGSYTNKLEQTFDITIKGIDENAVAVYTDNLRMCMELLNYQEPAFETDVTDETSGDDLGEEDVLRENPENLLILSNPSVKNQEAFPEGYIWVYVIDPKIAKDATHDYRKYCREGATTTVLVGTGGSVSATHYRRPPGGNNVSSSKSLQANQSKTWRYSGKATYDLRVKGTSTGTTSYSVSGTIWNFGFTAPPPNGGGSDCPVQ